MRILVATEGSKPALHAVKCAIKLVGALASNSSSSTSISVHDDAGLRHASASAGGFDPIVLGAKGRGAIADLLFGSVAPRVLVTTRMPVELVK